MKKFKYSFIISKEHIDLNHHVNNVLYVQRMQDVAIMHSVFVGDTQEFQQAHNATWFASSHQIEYKKPLYEGDELTIETTLGEFRKTACFREYLFLRGDEIVANAKTLWVFIDTNTSRPKAIPNDLINLYTCTPKELL